MDVVARIIVVSLLASALGAGIGLILFGQYGYRDYIVPTVFLGCVGAIIGAVAGAAGEIVTAVRQRKFPD
jgi:hypothetical protein